MAKQKSEVQEIQALRASLYNAYFERFIDLLINCIDLSKLPQDIPNDYVIKCGLRYGKIGVYNYKDKNNSVWLPVNESGVKNIYGVCDRYELVAENGRIIHGSRENTCIIRFTPTKRIIMQWLDLKINDLISFDIAIKNNLEATQTTCLITCPTENNKLSLKNIYAQRKLGVPAIIADGGFSNSIKVLDTNAPYLVDKLLADKQKVLNEIYASLGIVSGNADKKERVQSYDLPIDLAIDSIYTIIDTFNKDCVKFGIDARMQLNGAIEELYNEENEGVENEKIINDNISENISQKEGAQNERQATNN